MNEYLQQLSASVRELWGKLTPLQKGLATVVPVAVFVALAFMLAAVSRPPEAYGTLFADLPREDAAAIVSRLKTGAVPYRLKDDGGTIEVPIKDVYELRLSLANAGLPKGPGVGFELFDKTQVLGQTDAQQRVALKRALEGELTRTIMALNEIRTAKVNLALPAQSLFSEQQRDPTASVLVEVKRGYKLEPGQVRGIIHLVAMGVEGLKPQMVKVVDANGNVLSDLVRDELMDEAADSGAAATGAVSMSRQAKAAQAQLALQRIIEVGFEREIEEILGKVLGEGRAAAKVTAEVNFDQIKMTNKRFEPVAGNEGILRSHQRKNESYTGVGGIPGGVPGAESTIPGYQAVVGGNLAYTKADETRNFEVNERFEEIIRAPGAVKRLTVAVFVDNVQPQQHAAIERAVRAATGLDPTRGDVIAVENTPFDKTLLDQMQSDRQASDRKEREETWLKVGQFAAVAVVALLTLGFVRALVRPRVVRERVLVEVAGAPIAEPVEVVAPPPPPPPPPPPSEEVAPPPPLLIEPEPTAALERQRRAQIRQHVTRMARQRPEMIAQIIKRWLVEEKR